ncbi:hypothetical protein EQV77_14205 [Halobacillus fulvus]|nr:hypothetical protein EQV77_14205 [Halobacillus fulvus]
MKRFILPFVSFALLAVVSVITVQSMNDRPNSEASSSQVSGALSVNDFSGNNDAEKIQNAINAAANSQTKTVFLPGGDYTITSTIQLKQDVKLEFAHNARFVVYGNQDVLRVESNASIDGAYIAIDDPAFDANVLSFNGKHKYYNSWNRSTFENINIVNWSGSHNGTGINLYSGGVQHEISFLLFDNVKMAGLHTGIHLQADKASSGYSWINANTFNHITIDDAVRGIWMDSNVTVPNEVSGNSFTNLQIQLSAATEKALRVTGEFNALDGVIWDTHLVNNPSQIVHLTNESKSTKLDLRGNVEIYDQGNNNEY